MSTTSVRPPTSLSPSRAADFKTCPLMYRFRAIDRLPEPTTTAMMKGTLVHAVLERLYDLAAAERTRTRATAMLEPEWQRLQRQQQEAAELFDGEDTDAERQWLTEAKVLVESYFEVEDPTRLAPAERECLVEATLDDGVRMRGYIDRLDIAPGGEVRVVDYKTGKAPKPAFEAQALFQLKFYALALWRTRGVIPKILRLLYLKDSQVIDYAPTESELRRLEKTVSALWQTISQAVATGNFPAKKGPLCGWCSHQALCPEFGGTPPPYPLPVQLAGLDGIQGLSSATNSTPIETKHTIGLRFLRNRGGLPLSCSQQYRNPISTSG
ncbi:putative RecB family exonuclease [Stackebrandtia endophytica]|uniref:Putative RecB family exonuclease n=1 Tax=Stackebrandtia endophytica TaxID=1496996 RepID=A0A543ARA0_9ACTN|nr:RecB family exonuclease [Stackebrandtia endophytica]TQL75055.1 putative RecB family exonuclease [Stackebrandtia endophytica]